MSIESKRQNIVNSLKMSGYDVSYSKSKRRLIFNYNGHKHCIKMLYHSGYSRELTFSVDGHEIAVDCNNMYYVYLTIDKLCNVPCMRKQCDIIAKFIHELTEYLKDIGVCISPNGDNTMKARLLGNYKTRYFPTISVNPDPAGFEIKVAHNGISSSDTYSELDKNTVINLLCKDPGVNILLRGPAMKPFVDMPLVVKDSPANHKKHIYHGELISARITSIVAMNGKKIDDIDCIKPGVEAFFIAEVVVINDISTYRTLTHNIITDGDNWGEVYRGYGADQYGCKNVARVVLPSNDFELTLTDKELIGKAIAYYISTRKEETE